MNNRFLLILFGLSSIIKSIKFSTPRIDIKDLGNITPNREALPEIPKIERDYYEVSDADRERASVRFVPDSSVYSNY